MAHFSLPVATSPFLFADIICCRRLGPTTELPCPVPPSILSSPGEDFRSLFAHGCSAGHDTGTGECRVILSSRTRWKLQRYSKLKFCGGIYCYNGGRADANAFTVLSSFVVRWRSLTPIVPSFRYPFHLLFSAETK